MNKHFITKPRINTLFAQDKPLKLCEASWFILLLFIFRFSKEDGKRGIVVSSLPSSFRVFRFVRFC